MYTRHLSTMKKFSEANKYQIKITPQDWRASRRGKKSHPETVLFINPICKRHWINHPTSNSKRPPHRHTQHSGKSSTSGSGRCTCWINLVRDPRGHALTMGRVEEWVEQKEWTQIFAYLVALWFIYDQSKPLLAARRLVCLPVDFVWWYDVGKKWKEGARTRAV